MLAAPRYAHNVYDQHVCVNQQHHNTNSCWIPDDYFTTQQFMRNISRQGGSASALTAARERFEAAISIDNIPFRTYASYKGPSALYSWPSANETFLHKEFRRLPHVELRCFRVEDVVAARRCSSLRCFEDIEGEQRTLVSRYAGQMVSELARPENRDVLPSVLHMFGVVAYTMSGRQKPNGAGYTSRLFFEDAELLNAAEFLLNRRFFFTHDEFGQLCVLVYPEPGMAPEDGFKKATAGELPFNVHEPFLSFRLDIPRSGAEQQQFSQARSPVHQQHGRVLSNVSVSSTATAVARHCHFNTAPTSVLMGVHSSDNANRLEEALCITTTHCESKTESEGSSSTTTLLQFPGMDQVITVDPSDAQAMSLVMQLRAHLMATTI